MKTITWIVLVMVLSSRVSAATAADEPIDCYSQEMWDEWIASISTFDEIRMSIPFDQVIRVTRTGGSPMHSKTTVRDRVVFRRSSINDTAEFLSCLEFQPGTEMVFHACYGLFNIDLYHKGKRVGRMNYAHGEFGGPKSRESQIRLIEWLDRNGFPVKKWIQKERQANQALQTTPMTRSVCGKTIEFGHPQRGV